MSSRGTQLLKIGVLLVVAVFEIAMNAVFLAKGNEQGLLGGAAQALGFALLNIGVSFMFGLWPIRLLNHRSWPIKLLGVIGTVGYIAFATILNLALSHYREVSGTLTSDAGLEVMGRLQSAPLGLHDLASWLFFGVGLFFAIIAMADGIFFKDPYPGFDRVEKACVAAHDEYNVCVSELIERLRDVKDQASDDVRAVLDDLNVKFGEFDSIINARTRLNSALSDHQAHLERVGQILLFSYRDANRQARSSAPPAHFADNYNLPSVPTVTDVSSNTVRDGLLASISNMQELLNGSIDSVKKEFVAAARTYREIDDLIPERRDETISKAA